ncbi:hypothetical protein [Clostridium merdae]|uniref:hypothetical protein n=1 Tax=Clostridium merdae TaxID=1958780 RepID=UPI001FA8C8FF|nr:hypothetical protein [Clostridium merdae]
MNQPNMGYSAVYSQSGPCPSCGMGGWPQAAAQNMQPTTSAQAQMAAQIPPQTMPNMTPQITTTPYQQVDFQQPAGASPSASLTQGATTGPTGFVPNSPPESFSGAITDLTQPMPMTVESLQYLNGFLRTQIGRRVRVEFLLGTNTMTDRTGTLLGVGANYILINESDSDDLLACDFYNIKFIRFYY